MVQPAGAHTTSEVAVDATGDVTAARTVDSVEGAAERCTYCRRPLPEAKGVGRPRTYCRRSCRQRAFEQRRRATELSWGDDRLVELIRELELRGDRLAHATDVLDEVRRDLDDDVEVGAAEVVARLDAALR